MTHIEGFELLEEISRSDLWVLYKAREIERNLIVFVKLYPSLATRRIFNEAKILARLFSPYIHQIFDAREISDGVFLVLEYIDGPTLEGRVAGPKLSWHEAAGIFRGLAEGMRMAHYQDIIHCNLKPASILLTHSSPPKITGFEYAIFRPLGSHPQTERLQLPSNPISPEQIKGNLSAIGPHTDVYALGVILYQLMNWTTSLPTEEVQEKIQSAAWSGQQTGLGLLPGCPSDLEAICIKCLQQNSRDRYPDGSALVKDLEECFGPKVRQ